MSDSLFRQKVVNSKRRGWLGHALIAPPVSHWLMSVLAALLAVIVITFLFVGNYTRRESVSGQIVPSAGLLNLALPTAGTIVRIYVRDGQTVKAGDMLLELSTEQSSAALGDTRSLVTQQLDEQRNRLASDLDDQQLLAKQQRQSFREKVNLLRSQIAQAADQIAIQRQLTASNQELLDRIRPLGLKGYVSALQIQQQEEAVLNSRAQEKSLVRQDLDARQQLEAALLQLEQLPFDTDSKKNDTERQLASVAQSIAQNEMQRAVVLRAPRNGMVSSLVLKEGQATTSGQTLLSMLPEDSLLEAQLLVPSRAAGFIEPGSEVVLRYQAFPFQKFGQQYGRVAEVSRSALSTSEVSTLTGQPANEPLYRVIVTLNRQNVMAYGKPEPVKPGMAVDADILMDRRSLIEWVFEPLYGIGHRLFEEPARG